jgi:phosphatidylinositol alpha-mannosyltransferase
LAENKFDVLHVQVPYSPFMAQRVINASDDGVAVVGTFHVYPSGWLPRLGSVFLRMMYGASLQRVEPMLAVSSAAAEFAKDSYGLQTKVVPNVVELTRFRAAKKTVHDHPQIVFLGRLVERKGCRQLLQAFKLLHQKLPQARLIIAGDGPQRSRLEKFVKQNNLQAVVKFLGFIDEKHKPELLAGADVACFPSLYGESFGIVLIEAMAAGAGVVIGGDNPGYRSVLGGQPDLLFDPNDSEQLASRLGELLTDKRTSAGLHDWQQTEVKKYDVQTVGPQVLTVYRQAIAKNRPKGNN